MSKLKYDPKKIYVVVEGKAVTSKAGMRRAGDEVSEKMFRAGKDPAIAEKNGKSVMTRKVADGTFVEKPKKKADDKKADDKKADDKKADDKKDK